MARPTAATHGRQAAAVRHGLRDSVRHGRTAPHPTVRGGRCPAQAAPLSREAGFLRGRWRGEVPLPRLFWRDMLGLGTLVNLLATFVALMMAAQGAKGAVAAAVHFAPLPWNLFLAGCVLRHASARRIHRVVAMTWVVLTLVV